MKDEKQLAATLHDHFQHVHAIILRGRTRALAAATFHTLETY